MDPLRPTVVDLTTMVATCHALKSSPAEGELVLPRKLRSRLRRDFKRGTVAYIDALARTRRGMVDEGLLCRCRVAAERQMPQALAHQESLGHIMANEAGSLDGLAAARQDLWRLAHMAHGTACSGSGDVEWQLAHGLAGQSRNGVGERERQRRQARLADASRRVGAGNDMHRDLRHVGDTGHDKVAEVALLDDAVLQGDRGTRQAHRQSHQRAALDLGLHDALGGRGPPRPTENTRCRAARQP